MQKIRELTLLGSNGPQQLDELKQMWHSQRVGSDSGPGERAGRSPRTCVPSDPNNLRGPEMCITHCSARHWWTPRGTQMKSLPSMAQPSGGGGKEAHTHTAYLRVEQRRSEVPMVSHSEKEPRFPRGQEVTHLTMRMTTTMWNKMKYSFAAW